MGKAKFIVILGTIMSGLGKGILSASILKILSLRGYKILPIKFDGYLNVDCGTMNPFRHGEVFVLEDGTEVDMDFGTYERFLGINLDGSSSITGGKIFRDIIEKERKGQFLGQDVQFIPHVTNHIKENLRNFAENKKTDIVLIEVGGTVGDIETSYFIEALRQLSTETEMLFIQLTHIPEINGLQKTKPTQQANRLIQSLGIKPQMLVARTLSKLSEDAKEKLSLFCNVKQEDIFDDPDVSTLYELPLVLEKQNFFDSVKKHICLENGKDPEWSDWHKRVERLKKGEDNSVKIGIIGKYTKVREAYVSIEEALVHASAELGIKANIEYVDSSLFEKESPEDVLKNMHAIIIPGGFGKRGIEGKINAIECVRKNEKPFLGLCLGMQLMVIEYARNVAKMESANSTEFDKDTAFPVIDLLPEQKRIIEKGATMRLGGYEMNIKKGTLLSKIYSSEKAIERHRHRYEVNPELAEKIENAGLVFSGTYLGIVEASEYKNGKGLATQAHPELTSKFEAPNPFFLWLVEEAHKFKKKN